MKTLDTIYDYTMLCVCLLAAVQVVVFFSGTTQLSPYFVEIFYVLVVVIGLSIPPAIFLVYQRIHDESQKGLFRKLCYKWLGLLVFVMLLSVLAQAMIPIKTI